MDFRNSNGLLDGLIPKGKECPFKEVCRMRHSGPSQCHHLGVNHGVDFSCGAARAYSMIKLNKEA